MDRSTARLRAPRSAPGVPLITDPWFYLCAVPAVLLYGMSKGGLGSGSAILAVPILTLAIDPVRAAAIMLPILCVMDLFAIWRFRQQFDPAQLRIMLPAGIAGVAIASLSLGRLSNDAMRIVVGTLTVVFCLHYWLAPVATSARRPGRLAGYFWSCVSGMTSTQFHAGGPPANIYMLRLGLDVMRLMGTMAMFFGILNYVKLIPYALLGQFDRRNLLQSLVLMPLAPIGVGIGYWSLSRIEPQVFYRVLYLLLFLSGCKLLYDGWG